QSLNRYSYAYNSPINLLDQDGRCPQPPGAPPCSDITITVPAKNPTEFEYQVTTLKLIARGGPDVMMMLSLPEYAQSDVMLRQQQAERNQTTIAIVPLGVGLEVPEGVQLAEGISAPYCRPNGATTREQRASVQGKPCEICGTNDGGRRVAGHKEALIKEYYRTGA